MSHHLEHLLARFPHRVLSLSSFSPFSTCYPGKTPVRGTRLLVSTVSSRLICVSVETQVSAETRGPEELRLAALQKLEEQIRQEEEQSQSEASNFLEASLNCQSPDQLREAIATAKQVGSRVCAFVRVRSWEGRRERGSGVELCCGVVCVLCGVVCDVLCMLCCVCSVSYVCCMCAVGAVSIGHVCALCDQVLVDPSGVRHVCCSQTLFSYFTALKTKM